MPQLPGLHLIKSAVATDIDADGRIDLGDQVGWTFLVQDTGTVTVHSVTVDDPTAGAVSCPAGNVAPGASFTCAAGAHGVTQADVDAGEVDNTATASAVCPAAPTRRRTRRRPDRDRAGSRPPAHQVGDRH